MRKYYPGWGIFWAVILLSIFTIFPDQIQVIIFGIVLLSLVKDVFDFVSFRITKNIFGKKVEHFPLVFLIFLIWVLGVFPIDDSTGLLATLDWIIDLFQDLKLV